MTGDLDEFAQEPDPTAPRARVPGAPEFSRYEIQAKVGEGATAVIYRARDRTLHRVLALKVLRETSAFSDIARQRFRREAEATAGLSHPNLVTVYDVGEEEGRLFFAMELVEGRPLVDLLRERSAPLRDLVVLLEKAARGLGEAHRKGIVHRDVKPANILIGPGGEPKVGDFGLAHLVDSTTELTRSGVPLGTPLYMAPEQVEGRSKDISPRTDVFALGAILYEVATGRPPTLGDTVAEIYSKILREDPPAPRRLNPSLPADLETIILKAIEREPDRRYAAADALGDDLRRYLEGEPVDARPASTGYRLYRRIRKSPVVYGLSAGILCLIAVASILWLASRQRLKGEQEVAIRTLREKSQVALDAAIDLRRSGRVDLMQRYLPVLESAYKEAVVRAPGVAEVEYVMGRAQRMLMRDARALEYQNLALRKDPDFAPALYERMILVSKKYGTAWVGAKTQEDAERIQPELVAMREGLFQDLERLLRPRDAGLVGPTHLKAARGILAYYQGKIPEARELLEKVVQEDPLLEEGWETLGLTVRHEAYRAKPELQEELYTQAEAQYSRALSHDRGYAPFWLGRGFVRLHLGWIRQDRGEDPTGLLVRSEEDYAEAARLDSASGDVAVQRGMMYLTRARFKTRLKELRLEDFTRADEEFAKAIRLEPALAKAWLQRGRLRHVRGDFDRRRGEDPTADYAESERFLTEAARLDPQSRAWWFLGELGDDRASHALNQKADPRAHLEAALQGYTRAIQSGSPSGELCRLRGNASLRLARYREEKKDLPAARTLYAAALQEYRDAIKLDPSQEESLKKDAMAETERKLAELKSP